MNIINQKPVVLTPTCNDDIKADFDVEAIIKDSLVKPLFTPVLPGQPVTMTTSNNTPVTEDDIKDLIIRCCGDAVDTVAEQSMKTILGQTLMTFNANTNIGIAEMFVVQSGTADGLPEPSDQTVYTPAVDVIPACKQFLAGTCTYDHFFASLGYYARPETLGFYFVNELAFNNFIQWFTAQMAMLANVLDPSVNKLASDFMQLTLNGLTESIVLRNDDSDGNDKLSFPRLIVNQLMLYTSVAGAGEFGILPFNVGELICPKTIVFVNVEKHSKASAKQIADEWKLINSSLQNKQGPRMISNKSLRRLTATQRNMQKIASMAVSTAMNNGLGAGRAANIRFSKSRPSCVDMTRVIKKILDKMTFTNKSMNVYKSVKSSYAKPNRRDPDDYNKQGKIVSTRYKPDIHLYIDTSGSISERDYEDAVKACIAMAKKLNVNMYFNSFSHMMSQTTRLHLEGKSKAAIYDEFRKIPKVTGGTDYEQIWHFINKSKKRIRELSIIITDFEWTARSAFVRHPKNLYYIPCSTMRWDYITREAEQFAKSMLHNDPGIRNHLLF